MGMADLIGGDGFAGDGWWGWIGIRSDIFYGGGSIQFGGWLDSISHGWLIPLLRGVGWIVV